ncbi:MAG: acyl-CoA thioesterase [Desulfobacterales bacterium]|uniref:Acyl-CoA thioesterase n=1 Tax=Candidatus Desulfatibia profunda TaxID=2841695 RepID=A0A8J6TLN3_9BACT|nr:acyl-CoA thioesterase [Candidatus Desulfatibia profunda]MBL7179256.1 acyl-CoA thioesterase [Desulfobacterales bacterium]MBU0699217.1 acyl-CoA thioesterase [Pseudomonadota bacterium]
MLSHKTTHRVRYSDTDKMGFVQHANYFRWFEIGRSELFRHLGLSYKKIEANGFFLPLAEVHCKYLFPSKYDDVLIIETTLDARVKAGMKFDYHIYSEDEKTTFAKGYTKHACLDRNGRVVRPPDFLTAVFNRTGRSSVSNISATKAQRHKEGV